MQKAAENAADSENKAETPSAAAAAPKRAPKRRKQASDNNGSFAFAKQLCDNMGLKLHDERVTALLSEYMNRVANELANDAKDYAQHRDPKSKVTVDDIRLAAKVRPMPGRACARGAAQLLERLSHNCVCTPKFSKDGAVPLSRSELIDRAQEINSKPLPRIPANITLSLPPTHEQLISTNFAVRVPPPEPPAEAKKGARAGGKQLPQKPNAAPATAANKAAAPRRGKQIAIKLSKDFA
mmetsp:Transcript_18596/g.70351  ORF Transcript_18596/g.70351 Transcript_18596/m.70351 type:complete len:239 (+) Transcript_18596:47-763(+)